MKIQILSSYRDVPAAEWDAVAGRCSPCLEHTFLWGLEYTGCAVPETGWTPRPVLVYDDAGLLVGAAPAWLKAHSMGEFVYDHAWADAARQNRLPYYPKVVVAAPFTPVTGDRLCVRPGADQAAVRRALISGLNELGRDGHGLHLLFNPAEETEALVAHGAVRRAQWQYWWYNQGYADFEGFLQRFRSKDRNKLRRERRDGAALTYRAEIGPSAAKLRQLHGFYRRTCSQFGPWGRVYLSEDAFLWLGEHWGDRLHAVTAHDGGEVVAGALNWFRDDRLYGRYWGTKDTRPFLHFEVCYYQTIEWAIANEVRVFEPGHGGEHKERRGFEPTITWSSHWLSHPGFHDAVRRFCESEAAAVVEHVAALHADSPLKPI